MANPLHERTPWSIHITRVIGLWVLAGAVMKLLWGSAADLPKLIRSLPLDPLVTFRVAVAAELCIALLALLRPRWSWLLVIVLLMIFNVTLVHQVMEGETSCGCFGYKLDVPPEIVLGVDVILLLLLLLSKPWGAPGSDATGGLVAVLVIAVAVAMPWIVDREVRSPDEISPGGLPSDVHLDVNRWEGEYLKTTRLGPWIDHDALPASGLWIFYRDSCSYCAEILSWLAPTEEGARDIVLVRLPEDESVTEVEVHQKPRGAHVHEVDLRPDINWVLTAPGAMVTEGGRVDWAADDLDLEAFRRLDAGQ